MSKTTILRAKCPYEVCGKLAVIVSSVRIAGKVISKLECGHTVIKDQLAKVDPAEIVSSDGRMLFPYQIKTVEFGEAAGGNFICAHEMGVGKTIVAIATLMRNKEQMFPAALVVKSGLRTQWFHELIRWAKIIAQVIESGKEPPFTEMFPVVIISVDSLRSVRKTWIPKEHHLKFNTVIIDECQTIKGMDSQRTQAFRELFGHCKFKIALSGTPVKNNAAEYFSVLNFIRPDIFPSYAKFLRDDVVFSGNKYRGLKYPERFRQKTDDWIIRYTRDEVLPDLPKIFRTFRNAPMDEGSSKAYAKVQAEFAEFFDSLENPDKLGFADYSNILAYFSKMRQITGIAKVPHAVEFVEEFLDSNERKIVLFVHHKMVGDMLMAKLTQLCGERGIPGPVRLMSELDSQQRHEVVEAFRNNGHRILIASTLASGEGLNLQFCSDCLMVERQWNPANEEQAEARFPRPGSTADKINAPYLIAPDTIDEMFTEMVERKRSYMAQTLDGKEITWDESELVKELSHALAAKGRKSAGQWSTIRPKSAAGPTPTDIPAEEIGLVQPGIESITTKMIAEKGQLLASLPEDDKLDPYTSLHAQVQVSNEKG